MKKISFILALVIILSFTLASCGSSYKSFKVDPEYQSVRAENPNQTISGVDGIKKSVPKDIKSIVCFSPSAAVILQGVGSNGIITGVDKDTAKVITTAKQLTVEEAAAQKPDLMFLTDTYDTTPLDNAGVVYFVIPEVMTLNDVKTLIKVIEKSIGTTSESLTTAIDTESSVALQTTRGFANRYSAFIDIGAFKTTGSATYLNEVLNICGCDSIFADKEGIFTANKQDIIKANPEFIFTIQNKSVYTNDKDFENVKAVKNGNVYQIRANYIEYGSQNLDKAISDIFQKVEAMRNKSSK